VEAERGSGSPVIGVVDRDWVGKLVATEKIGLAGGKIARLFQLPSYNGKEVKRGEGSPMYLSLLLWERTSRFALVVVLG
jgi:hypothetical protein